MAAEQKARVQKEKLDLQAKAADYQTPEWAIVDEDELFTEEEEEQEEQIDEDFYCVVCDKAYRSEKQFTVHEASKRHIENVEILREEMLADEEQFDLGAVDELDTGVPVPVEEIADEIQNMDLQDEPEEFVSTKKNKKKNKKKAAPRWGYDEEDIPEDIDNVDALNAALEEERSRRRRKGGNRGSTPSPAPILTSSEAAVDDKVEEEVPVEKESAKTKREKRKEKKKLKEETEMTENDCNVCREKFDTRNQLFAHIKDTGHALAISEPHQGGKGKKGNKRR